MNSDAQALARLWLTKARNDLKIGLDEMQTPQPATHPGPACYGFQSCSAGNALIRHSGQPSMWHFSQI